MARDNGKPLEPWQVSMCRHMMEFLKVYSIEIGDPSEGGHWYNEGMYTGPARHLCCKWETLSQALYKAGYMYDLPHCIKYYIQCPDLIEEIHPEKDAEKIVAWLKRC